MPTEMRLPEQNYFTQKRNSVQVARFRMLGTYADSHSSLQTLALPIRQNAAGLNSYCFLNEVVRYYLIENIK